MIISNQTGNMFAAMKSANGNHTSATQANASIPTSSSTTVAPTEKTSSSIEELEIYFEKKISTLEEAGHDTSNVVALRDAIREAAQNKNGDSPDLPVIKEHPYGEAYLGNMHLSFGTEIKGELENLTQKIEQLNLSDKSNYSHLQKISNKSDNSLLPDKTQDPQSIQDRSSIRELAKTIDPSNMNRNEARALAAALGLSNDLAIDNALALQSMVLVNENGNLRTATEADTVMNEKFNMFDALENSIKFNESKGLPTDHLEDGLQFLEKLKTYRENPEVNVFI